MNCSGRHNVYSGFPYERIFCCCWTDAFLRPGGRFSFGFPSRMNLCCCTDELLGTRIQGCVLSSKKWAWIAWQFYFIYVYVVHRSKPLTGNISRGRLLWPPSIKMKLYGKSYPNLYIIQTDWFNPMLSKPKSLRAHPPVRGLSVFLGGIRGLFDGCPNFEKPVFE